MKSVARSLSVACLSRLCGLWRQKWCFFFCCSQIRPSSVDCIPFRSRTWTKMSVSYFYDLISTNEQIVGGGMCVVKASLLNLNPLGASGSLGDPMWRGRGRPPLAGHLPPPALGQKRAVLVLDAEHCLDRLYGGCFPGQQSCGTCQA